MSEDATLLELIAAEKPPDLTTVRKKAVELRDAHLQKRDLEEQVREASEHIRRITHEELPDLFKSAGIERLDVAPDGNHSGFVAELGKVYNARLPKEDSKRRAEALDWFTANGHGDLVKSVITIAFGMQEHAKRQQALEVLRQHGIECTMSDTVHPSTLKAFVKREIEAHHHIPWDLLGVFVLDEVTIKVG